MFGVILAVAITGQHTLLPPMTQQQLREYKTREGFVHPTESPKMKALARYYDRRNRRARNVSEMRFTIFSGVRYAWAHPPGSVYWRTHVK